LLATYGCGSRSGSRRAAITQDRAASGAPRPRPAPRSRRRTRRPGDLPRREVANDARSPLEALADSQAQLALERAFAGLAPAYREVALLVGVEGMQPSEVAQILGERPDAIRQRLARARTQIAGALGEHAPASWRTP
jgi:RNA polymerase sigma factor (sigma-70 family)